MRIFIPALSMSAGRRRWVAKEWRRVWQVACLVIPALCVASGGVNRPRPECLQAGSGGSAQRADRDRTAPDRHRSAAAVLTTGAETLSLRADEISTAAEWNRFGREQIRTAAEQRSTAAERSCTAPAENRYAAERSCTAPDKNGSAAKQNAPAAEPWTPAAGKRVPRGDRFRRELYEGYKYFLAVFRGAVVFPAAAS